MKPPPLFDPHNVDERPFSHVVGVQFENSGVTITLAMSRATEGAPAGLYVTSRLFVTEPMFDTFVDHLGRAKAARDMERARRGQHQ